MASTTLEISRVVLLNEVARRLEIPPPMCLYNTIEGGMYIGSVLLRLKDDKAPDGVRVEIIYSKPKHCEGEAKEEAAETAIGFLGQYAKATFDDVNYEEKSVLDLRVSHVKKIRDDICLENMELEKKVKFMKNGWKKTIEGVNKMMKKCSDTSVIRLDGRPDGPLYPEFMSVSYPMETMKSALFHGAEKLGDIHDEATKNKVLRELDG